VDVLKHSHHQMYESHLELLKMKWMYFSL